MLKADLNKYKELYLYFSLSLGSLIKGKIIVQFTSLFGGIKPCSSSLRSEKKASRQSSMTSLNISGEAINCDEWFNNNSMKVNAVSWSVIVNQQIWILFCKWFGIIELEFIKGKIHLINSSHSFGKDSLK